MSYLLDLKNIFFTKIDFVIKKSSNLFCCK